MITMPDLTEIFNEVYKDLTGKDDIIIKARFYKYAGVKSQIRLSNRVLEVKVSDALKDAPDKVLTALAYVLLSKMNKKPCPKIHQRIYRLWINSDEMNAKHIDLKKNRGRKIVHKPQGAFYNLEDMFNEINKKYFSAVLSVPYLYFGPRITTRKYGHYDPSKHSILISKTLDSSKVPRYVTEFVLYHEMLHIIHDVKKTAYSNCAHHAEFKTDEQKFERYKEANRFLTRISTIGMLKKSVRLPKFFR